MTHQIDSITQGMYAALSAADSAATDSQAWHPHTPYEVLRMLPRDATPAQQDSAIQAWLKPAEITYSSCPDTLHLPGIPLEQGKNKNDEFYREHFFTGDSLFQTEVLGDRYGVAGDPVPYTLRSDNLLTSLMLISFVILVVSFSNARRFIVRQLKDFFYFPHNDSNISETSSELRFQLFLVLLACLLLAITTYQYARNYVADSFMLDSDFLLIGLFTGSFIGYFIVKGLLYWLVNAVFFEPRSCLQWPKQLLFLIATEGVLLFPAVLLLIYFDLTIEKAAYYITFVLILVKILTFYKSWSIFFRRKGIFLQNFLYFCALEIVPLLGLASGLGLLMDQLKINY